MKEGPYGKSLHPWERLSKPALPDEEAMSNLLYLLDQAGAPGLDMSPGDSLCKTAAATIRILIERLAPKSQGDCCCAIHHQNHGRCLQCPIHGITPPQKGST